VDAGGVQRVDGGRLFIGSGGETDPDETGALDEDFLSDAFYFFQFFARCEIAVLLPVLDNSFGPVKKN
jgi:hypothetical protein